MSDRPFMRSGRIVAALAAAVLLVSSLACGEDEPATTTEPAPSGDVGLANPASVYCVEQGGTVEIVDEEGGQVGYCNLPDGRRVEEWELFRSETGGTVP